MVDHPDDNTLAAMLDGRLSPDEREALEAHLDDCPDCRNLVGELARTLSEQSDLPDVDRLAGRYEIVEVLGRGGMGQVFRAWDRTLSRPVALKVVHPTTGDEDAHQVLLTREARLMAGLHHPNVVTVYDVFEQDGVITMAMELINGQPLSRWVERERTLDEVLDVFIAVCSGLSAAHAAGLVHRDVKPANILIDLEGRPRITDFGLARIAETPPPLVDDTAPGDVRSAETPQSPIDDDTGPPLSSMTRPGVAIGTPAYMAPEQHLGVAADARSDVFGLAATLYHAAYGRPPFRGLTARELALEALTSPLETPPLQLGDPRGRAKALHAIIARGLRRDAEQRHSSMEELGDDLRVLREGPPGRPWLRLAVMVAVLGLAVALVLLRLESGSGVSTPSSSDSEVESSRVESHPSGQTAEPGSDRTRQSRPAELLTGFSQGALGSAHGFQPTESVEPPSSNDQIQSAVSHLTLAQQRLTARDGQGCLDALEGVTGAVDPASVATIRSACLMLTGDCDAGARVAEQAFSGAGSPDAVARRVKGWTDSYCSVLADDPQASLDRLLTQSSLCPTSDAMCQKVSEGLLRLGEGSGLKAVAATRWDDLKTVTVVTVRCSASADRCSIANTLIQRLESVVPAGAEVNGDGFRAAFASNCQ